MNVVFLDIDGVLVSWKDMGQRAKDGERPFRDYAIEALNEITKLIDGKIVISSTWRKSRNIERFQELFKSRGIEAEVIGLTEELDTGRASEIKKWIEDNDVEYFIIIDDNTRGIEEHFKENMNVLRTNLYRGLDHYDYLYVERGFQMYNSGLRKQVIK